MDEKEFRKTMSCPPSDALLSFAESDIGDARSGPIADHAYGCDFCDMEVRLYRMFPQTDEEVETPLIPRALYQLAKSILSPGGSGRGISNGLFGYEGELELRQTCGAF